MLQDIIDSKTDSAVLSFFLAAPERSFSIVELSKRLKLSPRATAKSLHNLVQLGPVKNFVKKGKKYFIVNSRYALLGEMKNYWHKEGVKYQDELFVAIKKLGQINAAFLSGIFCGHATLPVDLLLVGKVNLKKLAEFLKHVQKLMGQDINYSIMSVEEFLLRRNTFDKFIKDIFDYNHLVVLDELTKKTNKKK